MHRGEVILLPAFPHYSIATWKTVIEETEKYLPEGRLKTVRPFYDCKGFITGWVEEIKKHVGGLKKPFLLFSAHSLPLYLIKRGDPYPEQVKESARLIAKRLNLPFAVSYQSKLGPLKWLEPSTEEALKKISSEGVKEVVVIPISFTTENSETLYEIDRYYNKLSRKVGIERFVRPPVPYDSPNWIDCFKKLIEEID
jgi:ferrochelatase